ncbi:MAG TPA: hypothetical protein VE591_07130 [Candidatus Acidoferrum sp.]|nr:hypothetical protein [Candidatus Acidoferrum sp.]
MIPTMLSVSIALAGTLSACARGQDVAAPTRCTPDVNAQLARLIATDGHVTVDNVMVCGTTLARSRVIHSRYGTHHVLPLSAPLPGDGTVPVEVVANDDLDGPVVAPRGATVVALGQLYIPAHGRFVAGLHDVHCATHRGAENGFVIVDGRKYPPHC